MGDEELPKGRYALPIFLDAETRTMSWPEAHAEHHPYPTLKTDPAIERFAAFRENTHTRFKWTRSSARGAIIALAVVPLSLYYLSAATDAVGLLIFMIALELTGRSALEIPRCPKGRLSRIH
ncbi:hypothetical protein FISHEDRAFT_71423 [Fistulina hepatica ATCC 64428]|nr:hypothetical protein FISHEDRAFT_71423 [Fistulina hepatica ATCC 64428]